MLRGLQSRGCQPLPSLLQGGRGCAAGGRGVHAMHRGSRTPGVQAALQDPCGPHPVAPHPHPLPRRLMGRAASHITLECALQTHPQARACNCSAAIAANSGCACVACLGCPTACSAASCEVGVGPPASQPAMPPAPSFPAPAAGADLRGGGGAPLGPQGRGPPGKWAALQEGLPASCHRVGTTWRSAVGLV